MSCLGPKELLQALRSSQDALTRHVPAYHDKLVDFSMFVGPLAAAVGIEDPLHPAEASGPTTAVGRVWSALAGRWASLTTPGSKAQAGSRLAAEKQLREASDAVVAAEVAVFPGGTADRAIGSLVGLAIGDSVGSPLEFVAVRGVPHPASAKAFLADHVARDDDGHEYLVYQAECNRFELSRGQWTDDTSMALCLADSLIALGGQYDGSDCRVRYFAWWNCGYNNAFRFDQRSYRGSVGLGGNIAKSLAEVGDFIGQPTRSVPPTVTHGGEDAGNGALMRLAPIAIVSFKDRTVAMHRAVEMARGTHPGPDAAASAAFLAFVVSTAVERGPLADTPMAFIDRCVTEFLADAAALPAEAQPAMGKLALLLQRQPLSDKEALWNWGGASLPIAESVASRGRSYNGHPVAADYFGAYSLDCLAMALHAFTTTETFMDCIKTTVNLLGDADSTAAVAGQIAGAFYGHSAIAAPTTAERAAVNGDEAAVSTLGAVALRNLERWDPMHEIQLRGALLHHLATTSNN